MPNENIYKGDFEKFQKSRKNNNSNTVNQSISNEFPGSDLRNKINKNKRKPNFDNIVIECQSEEINESECRIRKIQIAHKQVFTSNDIELYKEYVQWDFINNKLYMKGKNVLDIVNNEGKQEFTNILKRWLNIINKDFSEVPKYEYYPMLPKINVEHLAAQFLRKELIAKQFVTEKDANDKIREILNFISTNNSRVIPCILADPMNVEYDCDRNILIVNKFKRFKMPRVKLLPDQNGIISTAKLLLREESLGNFLDEDSRSAVECQRVSSSSFSDGQHIREGPNKEKWGVQSYPQSGRVDNESEWRNRKNDEEEKRKIYSLNKHSERNNQYQRNDKMVNEEEGGGVQSHPQRARADNESEWRNRQNNHQSNKQMRMSSSFSAGRQQQHREVVSNKEVEGGGRQPRSDLVDNDHELVGRNRRNDNDKNWNEEVRVSSSFSGGPHRREGPNKKVEGRVQYQPLRGRVDNESEWRNRQNNEEEKRKIDSFNKHSERNNQYQRIDKIVNEEWKQQQERGRADNESEWRNRQNDNQKNWNKQVVSISEGQHCHEVSNKKVEGGGGQPKPIQVNSGLEWRDIRNDDNKQQVPLHHREVISNKEVKGGGGQPRSDLVDNDNELEWRNPPQHNNRNSNNNKVILSSPNIDLYKEYVQWVFINNELYEKGELLLNVASNKERREFTNTLQRWFIFINEDFNDVPKYEYFTILPDIPLEHPAAQFLRTALIEKEFANEDDADWKMRKILGFISSNHSKIVLRESADPLHVEHDPVRKIVVVNKFQSAEVPRVNLLVKKGGVIATARMLLRYESFGNGSYQWGDPEEIHKVLYDKFNVRYEGFASPVNSRFIEYDDTHFCSLFPETDEAFGSIGNFFHVDMKKHAGGWSVNPPFLNDLMKNVADRINKILDEGHKCYFFCTFPWWEDDEGWQTLNDSRYLLKRFNLPPQHFKVQNAYGEKFVPKMAMNLFVMGELPSMEHRLIELGNTLVHQSKEALPEYCPW